MKDLKDYIELRYIIEAIKPPRLSAKNKELWKNGLVNEKAIMEWLRENCKIKGSVEIVDDKINVRGGVIVRDNVEEFPYPFGEVTGFFICYGCEKLKSLNNSPQRVGGYFDCSFCNNLTSLEGAPQEVGNFFGCSNCKNIKSLEGAPQKVGSDFDCWDCGKEFTKEDVRRVCKVEGNIFV